MSNTVWVPVYKCERCGMETQAMQPRYNDYGTLMFPNVDAAPTVQHRCKKGTIGLARLVGLNAVTPVAMVCVKAKRRAK